MILDRPSTIIRIEGAAVFAATAYVYASTGWNLLIFVVVFLAVDLGMLGYLSGQRAGAMIYNLFHNYLMPLALIAVGTFGALELAVQIGVIWLAHIGADRALGYGLKTPGGFKSTHIQQLRDVETQTQQPSSTESSP